MLCAGTTLFIADDLLHTGTCWATVLIGYGFFPLISTALTVLVAMGAFFFCTE